MTNEFPPALIAYLNRIGAEVLNFRRAIVKQYINGTNYYKEVAIIQFGADGTIKCSNKEHEPTTEEREAITAEWPNFQQPTSITAPPASFKALLQEHNIEAKSIWPLIDRRTGGVRMAQQRVDKSDGSKYYIPWSFWSDGEWRKMECDGAVPFYKPLKKQSHKIMLHEGAKAAAFADWLVNSQEAEAISQRNAHPWAEALAEYEHWGLIGGAMAAGRADYDELRREQPAEVVMLCDNDQIGRDALQEVSFYYGGRFKGIYVPPNSFKPGWDIADQLPAELFSEYGHWLGPKLDKMMFSATWATEVVPGTEDKPKYRVTRHFQEEWAFALRPEVYVNSFRPDEMWDEKTFNIKVQPFCHVKKPSELLHKRNPTQGSVITYQPGTKPGFVTDAIGKVVQINTWTPTDLQPVKGDVKPWLEFMEQLLPIESDRQEVLRWCATLIAKPDVKMAYGLLLISEAQGVGKTTLGEKVLAPLVGLQNVSFPGESMIVESSFNEWIAHKRLAVVNEIYAGQSAKAYNKLKSLITDQRVMVNRKFQSEYVLENNLHIFACSNSTRALRLALDDRRWYVPAVTESVRPYGYWRDFNVWLRHQQGLERILQWAQEWALNNKTVSAGGTAPNSKAKKLLIEEQLSPGQQLVMEVLASIDSQLGAMEKKPFVTDITLHEFIKQRLYGGRQDDRIEKPSTIRKLAKYHGWWAGERSRAFGGARAVALSPVKEIAEMEPNRLVAFDGAKEFKIEDLSF